MRTKLWTLLPLFLMGACQTAERPNQLSEAHKAFDTAQDADADDVLPRSMELAEQQLGKAESLWSDSLDKKDDNKSEAASQLENDAIKMAVSSKAISENAKSIVSKLKIWDADMRIFANQQNQDNLELQTVLITPIESHSLVGGDLLEKIPVAYFGTDEATISDSFKKNIASLAKFLQRHPEAKVTLHGFADERGTADYNEQLSQERANTVADHLAKAGIDRSRLTVTGEGSMEIEAGEKPASFQLARKVEASIQLDSVAH